MDWSLRKLTLKQLTRQLKPLAGFETPASGWIRAIREAMGMNTRQLASRVGVTSERIIKIESDELENKLTMATLRKIAEAMNCRFVYAFVPDDNLEKIVENEARKKARQNMARISHTMALEDQKVRREEQNEQVEILVEEYLRGNIKKIWDE